MGNVKIGSDFSDLFKDQQAAAQLFLEMDKKVSRVGESLKSLRFDDNNISATFDKIDSSGKKIRSTAQLINNEWKTINTTVLSTNKALQQTAALSQQSRGPVVQRGGSIDAASLGLGVAKTQSDGINAALSKTTPILTQSAKAGQLLGLGLNESSKQANILNRNLTKSTPILRSVNREIRNTSTNLSIANQNSRGLVLNFNSMVRLVQSSLLSRGISQIASGFREAADDARELSIRVAEISTIDTSGTGIGTITQEVRNLSNELGLDVIDVAKAQYQALSNQVVTAANSYNFMLQSARLAKAGLSTTEQSVNLLTSAINAYGLSSLDAEEVSDSFFKTVELGRLRIADIADTFGRSAVLANQLGVTLNETQATLALFTRQGIKASQAQTLLRAIFLKLIKPTEQMKQFLSEIGFETGEAAIKSLGFAQVLSLIEQRASDSGNSLDELGDLFSRVRAITGATIFDTKGLKEFTRDLNDIRNSAGATEKALGTIQESAGDQLTRKFNKLRNEVLGVGSSFNNFLLQADKSLNLFEALGEGAAFLSRNLDTILTVGTAYTTFITGRFLTAQGLKLTAWLADTTATGVNTVATVANSEANKLRSAAMLGTVITTKANTASTVVNTVAVNANATALGRAATASKAFAGALAASPLLPLVAVSAIVGTIISQFDKAGSAARAFEQDLLKINENAKKADRELTEAILRNIRQRQNAINDVLAQGPQLLARNITQDISDADARLQGFAGNFNLIREGIEAIGKVALKNINNLIKTSSDQLKELDSKIKSVQKSSKDLSSNVADERIAQQLLTQRTGAGRRSVIGTEIGRLQAQAGEGSFEEQEQRLKKILTLQKQLQGLEGTRGNKLRIGADIGITLNLLQELNKAEEARLKVAQAQKTQELEKTKAIKEQLALAVKKLDQDEARLKTAIKEGKNNENIKAVFDDVVKSAKNLQTLAKQVGFDLNFKDARIGEFLNKDQRDRLTGLQGKDTPEQSLTKQFDLINKQSADILKLDNDRNKLLEIIAKANSITQLSGLFKKTTDENQKLRDSVQANIGDLRKQDAAGAGVGLFPKDPRAGFFGATSKTASDEDRNTIVDLKRAQSAVDDAVGLLLRLKAIQKTPLIETRDKVRLQSDVKQANVIASNLELALKRAFEREDKEAGTGLVKGSDQAKSIESVISTLRSFSTIVESARSSVLQRIAIDKQQASVQQSLNKTFPNLDLSLKRTTTRVDEVSESIKKLTEDFKKQLVPKAEPSPTPTPEGNDSASSTSTLSTLSQIAKAITSGSFGDNSLTVGDITIQVPQGNNVDANNVADVVITKLTNLRRLGRV